MSLKTSDNSLILDIHSVKIFMVVHDRNPIFFKSACKNKYSKWSLNAK